MNRVGTLSKNKQRIWLSIICSATIILWTSEQIDKKKQTTLKVLALGFDTKKFNIFNFESENRLK